MSILMLYLFANLPAAADEVAVEFRVRVPEATARGATVYLAGGLAPLGRLRRGDDGLYRARVDLPRGAALEFKATLGSWRTVEKGKGGVEIPNRRIVVGRDAVVEVEVAAWASADAARPKPTLTGDVRFHRD